MPRIALACAALLGACAFDANYAGGKYRCSDGICPSGLSCVNAVCVTPMMIDARVDTPRDAPEDGHMPALTCVDPGMFSGGSASGTTVANHMSASCGGFVMNGYDAVYRVTATIGQHVMVSVTGQEAYVLAPCVSSPQTPACLGNTLATGGNPISVVAATTGDQFVVVDNHTASTGGAYTLDVTVGP